MFSCFPSMTKMAKRKKKNATRAVDPTATLLLQSPGGYLCLLCEKPLDSAYFKRHMYRVHDFHMLTDINIVQSNDIVKQNGFACKKCDYFTAVKYNYVRHCENIKCFYRPATTHQLYKTGHLWCSNPIPIDVAAVPSLPRSKMLDGKQLWRNVLVELVDEFGIDPKLGEILQTPITQVLDGTTLKTFLLQCGSKMIEPLPTRFIDGGRVWLQSEAKYAVSNILPQVRNAMVVFRLGTDYETNFIMRENLGPLLEELEKLIGFTWKTCDNVLKFENQNRPDMVPAFLYAVTTQQSDNNFFNLPTICKYVIYRMFDVKIDLEDWSKSTMKLRGYWALSSTTSTILHLLRLGSLSALSTFQGKQFVTQQLAICR